MYERSRLTIFCKKYTAHQFIKMLKADGNLEKYEVNKADRKHHFWKRNSLVTELFTPAVFMQKLNYIHYNPVRGGLCSLPEDYKYSSALWSAGRRPGLGGSRWEVTNRGEIIGIIAIDVFSGIAGSPGDNVAHFAHVGGAITGFLIVYFQNRGGMRVS